jgi:tetratricopeptide (TPR) repeat protein
MLFDLRAPGRRRAIKVIYALLAVLMGLGLILFGIGGEVTGGLFDGLGIGGGNSTSNSQFEERVEDAEKRIQANPRNAAAWAELARARYQVVTSSENYDQNTGQFTEEGKQELRGVAEAWERYLELDPKKIDPNVAALMAIVYSEAGLDNPKKAAQAQSVVAADRPSSSTYFTLATYYYLANQQREGDLAADRAIELAPKTQRKQVREQIDQLKQQIAQQQAQEAQAQAEAAEAAQPPPPPPTPTPPSSSKKPPPAPTPPPASKKE